MKYVELILFTIIGAAGVVYAFNSHRFEFSLPDHLPGKLGKRKIIFVLGVFIILVGFVLDYVIGSLHQIITLAGGWFMLLGSAPWFNRRIVRRLFDPIEMRIIRITIHTGLLLAVMSTGFFWLPPHFSPGTFLIAIAHVILGGRLWWNMDVTNEESHMVFSKRDYS